MRIDGTPEASLRNVPALRDDMPPVVIVGAGWAGLSAALHLRRAGVPVQVLEAAPQAGGRARSQTLPWPDTDGIVLDNGQHLLLGAYRDTLALVDWLGGQGMQRMPMHWENAAGLRLTRRRHAPVVSGDAPVGLNPAESLSLLTALLSARGLTLGQRLHLLRTLALARLSGWHPPMGVRTVADWYARTHQPPVLVRQLWDPLVVSAMNTPPELASAQVFLRVLRDSLGRAPAASDFVLAGQDLGALFVDPALAWLEAQGCPVRLRTPVREIRVGRLGSTPGTEGAWTASPGGVGYMLRTGSAGQDDRTLQARHVILACPPPTSARLLASIAPASFLAPLNGFGWRPITTAYVGWRATNPDLPARLPAVFSLVGDQGEPGPAHWFFDRGEQASWRLGAMVISDSEAAQAEGEAAFQVALQHQLAELMRLPPAEHMVLIHEKRATFACTDDRPTVPPGYLLPQLPGVVLAGDYSYGGYPATLEGAVRSGRMAAEILLDDLG